MQQVVWHGTDTERDQLLTALTHNCECSFNLAGARQSTCNPHRLLVEDQQFVDNMLFMRRIAWRLKAEEAMRNVPGKRP